MKTYLAILAISALAAFLFTPLVARLAVCWGAIDLPGGRKVHQKPMPRLGGLAVFIGFCFPWAGFYLLDNLVTETFQNYEKLFAALMVGAAMMLALGVWDDLKGLNALQKFAIQIATAVGLYGAGFQITVLSNPLGGAIELGHWSLPVSVLWIVGITNAINLLDGIDGLAAGVTACIALSLALINILANHIIVALLTLCLAGACLGFLPYNFSPARIFLGDSGSLFIGIVLACIGVISLFKAATATFVTVPLILFGLPLLDTTSVFLGRLFRGAPLFRADQTHVHHRLLQLGLNHKQAALFLYCIAMMLGAAAVFLTLQQSPATFLTGVVLAVGLLAFLWLARRWRRANFPPESK